MQWRKDNLFNNWCWENWSTTCKRMKLEHFLIPYTKINSKWIKDLNVRPETIKLLVENRGKTLSEINHSRIPYDPPPRVMEIKAKINKWDLIKLKSHLHNEGNYKQGKKTDFRMGENKANKTNDKELISKIYKQLIHLNTRKINDPNQKLGQITKQTFLQRWLINT